MNETRHAIGLGALLAGLWIVLSGYFSPLLLAQGAGSCILALYLALRMDRIDTEAIPIAFRPLPWCRYVGWLGWEIVKANIAVTRVLLDPKLPVRPSLIRVHATQRSLLGRVTYANSITLTPGTVSIDLHPHALDVHSLLEPSREELHEMDRRVTALERPA